MWSVFSVWRWIRGETEKEKVKKRKKDKNLHLVGVGGGGGGLVGGQLKWTHIFTNN